MASTLDGLALARTRWLARYRDPAGQQRSKSFDRKIDAERFLISVENAKLTGGYIDPTAARLTWASGPSAGSTVRRTSNLSPGSGTPESCGSTSTPRWGSTEARRRLPQFRADLGLRGRRHPVGRHDPQSAPRSVTNTGHGRQGRAARPKRCRRHLAAPRQHPPNTCTFTHQQVQTLANECGPYRLVVLFLAYTGVRFGELAALRVGRLDLVRRRAAESRSRSPWYDGVQTWGTPKGHEQREVPIPRFLADELASLIVAGKTPPQS